MFLFPTTPLALPPIASASATEGRGSGVANIDAASGNVLAWSGCSVLAAASIFATPLAPFVTLLPLALAASTFATLLLPLAAYKIRVIDLEKKLYIGFIVD